MKALKNESSLYMEQIVSAITACCGSNDKPSNRSLMELYTMIGRCICGQGEKAFVAHLAESLAIRFPLLKGFSLRNLRRMRDFYRTYANSPALMEKAQSLSWTQNAVILECCETDEHRSFYICLAAAQNLSKLALMKAIQENAFDALSNEESPESNLAPVSDISSNTGVDTAASIVTACAPFVPGCEPFRQGDDMPSRTGRLSTAVSAWRESNRQTKRKADDDPPPLSFINNHPPDPPPIVLWFDKLKPPQNFPHGVRPRMENLRELFISAIKQNAPAKWQGAFCI
ncbi:DUF1016 N-terminal domain-containing protein [Lacrimispora sp.]|uniref:DUF1016 N-terminal domain-containing protein n=1 Tax=Lacrimispora sp. TaxID=2719234 RepID=UPI0029DF5C06|nr:hypothetical protein [Lacrimispora sp.]